MVRADYVGSAVIHEWYGTRMTRNIFRIIVNECLDWAMNCPEHDEMAEVKVGTAKYFIGADTWMDGSRVFGEVNVFKDTLNNTPIYTKDYILAD